MQTDTAAPARTSHTVALSAADLSRRTTDVHRHNWTKGKLRLLCAVLPADLPVAIVTDKAINFTQVGVYVQGVVESTTHTDGGPRIRDEHGATVYSWRNIGETIIPLEERGPRLGSELRDLWQRLSSAATAAARAEHGETAGRAWGQWTANVDTVRPTGDGQWRVEVRYTPHTGNPHFADQWGTPWWGAVTVAPRER